MSRLDKIADDGGHVDMPGVGECFYVAEMWQDMGLVSSGGMGPMLLSSVDILAWRTGTKRTVTPWEFSTIREMSMSYLTMLREGEKPGSDAPFDVRAFDPEVIEQRLLASIEHMISK